jgi:hypothetical protein
MFKTKIENLKSVKRAISIYNKYDDLLDDDIADICSVYRAKNNQIEKQLNDIIAYPFIKVISYKNNAGNPVFKYFGQTCKNAFQEGDSDTKAHFFENSSDVIFVEAPQKVYDKLIQTSDHDRIFPAKSAETIRSILLAQGKDTQGIINTKTFFGVGMTKLAEMMEIENPSIFKYEDWVKNVKLNTRSAASIETLENAKYFYIRNDKYSLNEILAMSDDYAVYPIQYKTLFTANLKNTVQLSSAWNTVYVSNKFSSVFPKYNYKKTVVIGYGDYKKLLAKSPKTKQLKVWDTEIKNITTFEELESMYKNTFTTQYSDYPDFFEKEKFVKNLNVLRTGSNFIKTYSSLNDEQKTRIDDFIKDVNMIYDDHYQNNGIGSRREIAFIASYIFNKRFDYQGDEKSFSLGYSKKYPCLNSYYRAEDYVSDILNEVVTYKKIF